MEIKIKDYANWVNVMVDKIHSTCYLDTLQSVLVVAEEMTTFFL